MLAQESPRFVLQNCAELYDWIAVECAAVAKTLSDDQKARLRGTVQFCIYSDAVAAWNTIPWRLVSVLGKCHLNVEFGFYSTDWGTAE